MFVAMLVADALSLWPQPVRPGMATWPLGSQFTTGHSLWQVPEVPVWGPLLPLRLMLGYTADATGPQSWMAVAPWGCHGSHDGPHAGYTFWAKQEPGVNRSRKTCLESVQGEEASTKRGVREADPSTWEHQPGSVIWLAFITEPFLSSNSILLSCVPSIVRVVGRFGLGRFSSGKEGAW